MSERDPNDVEELLRSIHAHVEREALRITQHAQQEMTEEGIVLEEALEGIRSGRVIENYPAILASSGLCT